MPKEIFQHVSGVGVQPVIDAIVKSRKQWLDEREAKLRQNKSPVFCSLT